MTFPCSRGAHFLANPPGAFHKGTNVDKGCSFSGIAAAGIGESSPKGVGYEDRFPSIDVFLPRRGDRCRRN